MKIKFYFDYEDFKGGQVIEMEKEPAFYYLDNGLAEAVTESKPKAAPRKGAPAKKQVKK